MGSLIACTSGSVSSTAAATAAGVCGESGWPALTRGAPRQASNGNVPAYALWHNVSGWHLRVRGAANGTAWGRIAADRTLTLLEATGALRPALATGARSFGFRVVGAGAGTIHFLARCARRLSVSFSPGAVGLGAREAPASSFAVTRPPTTGVTGRIILGPTCAVVTPSCPPAKQVSGSVRIEAAAGTRGATHRLVKHVATDSHGRFATDLPAGDYVLTPVSSASGSPYPAPRAVQVRVEPGVLSQVTLVLDTGIR